MRQIIISAIGILILVGAIFISRSMANYNRPEAAKENRDKPTVFTQKVENKNIPINVTAGGNLAALNRVEIYAEVQGIFEESAHRFDPGTNYSKGSVLLRLNSDEHRANLRAQKSSLYNQLVTLLPDLRFDYADAFPKWEKYVMGFDVEAPLAALPAADSDREKLFIAGRNINTLWHNVKNLEERLAKYTIYAPFNGVLTEALVDKGTLIRSGQKLGTFIDPSMYELEVAVNAAYVDMLQAGKSVELHDVAHTGSWKGSVSRLNRLVDPGTQTVQAYIRVRGNELREGMYLEADLSARSESNAFELSRKLLVDNKKVFVVRDSTLELVTIDPVYFKDKTVVVRGLEDGVEVLSRSLPGAYEGMKVQVFEEGK
ncbi:MAG: efflux RND transporter periplasmic adaptor subunit [Saprospiraceae bacterium]